MRRTVTVLTVMALAPLLMGGGGPNPGVPANKSITGPAVSGIVVMDPHQVPVTPPTAKQASIRLQKGNLTSGAVFNVPPTFLLFRGCDLSRTTERFVITADRENKLRDWIPEAIVTQLFADLGIAVSPTNVPVITDVDRAVCTADPENPGPISDGGDGNASTPGMLSMEVLIQFLVPSPRQNP